MNEIFTTLAKGFNEPFVGITGLEWWAMHDDPEVKHIAELVDQGKEHMKNALPKWTCHCAAFKDNHRSNADALHPLDHRLMMDFDEKGHTDEILARCMKLQEAGKWKILLVEDSIRHGTHVLIVLPKNMEAEEAQQRFSTDVGFQADPAVKDKARCIFFVPRSYVRYVHPDFFRPESDVCEQEEEGKEAPKEAAQPSESELKKQIEDEAEPENRTFPTHYKGISYETIRLTLETQLGGPPVEGGRNNHIYAMACQLRQVCDDNPLWIAQVLPTYGEERQKWMNTIQSACKRVQSPYLSDVMRKVLRVCELLKQEEDLDRMEEDVPPPMPKDLPPLIRLLLSRMPEVYQPATAHAVFPPLATYLYQTFFRYIDNVLHEATLMCCLMAETGSGKSCINPPIRCIMEPIDKRDAVNRQRDKEWKQEVSLKGANKDKRKRPEGLVVQHVNIDMTPAAFTQRLADAGGHFLYANTDELDRFDVLKSSARAKNHFQIMCLAFDPGNMFGQERVGPNAICENVTVRFNWNASATIKKGKAYFRGVLTDGPISRINFCTIPTPPPGTAIPEFGDYDDAFKEELKPYLDRLSQARGLVECPQIRAFTRKLVEECADKARLSDDRVYWNLSFRACVIAFLKGMLLYVAHGEQWDETMEEFIRWSLHYDLWCKMRFFGKEIEMEEYEEEPEIRRGPKNLLDLLPEVFTREDAQMLRQRQGIRQGSVKYMLSNWKKRGYIEVYGEVMSKGNAARQQYAKTAAYLKDHPQKGGQVVG